MHNNKRNSFFNETNEEIEKRVKMYLDYENNHGQIGAPEWKNSKRYRNLRIQDIKDAHESVMFRFGKWVEIGGKVYKEGIDF